MTQLRTFAWVRVPERIQAAVTAEMEREKRDAETGKGKDGSRSKGKGKEKALHTPTHSGGSLVAETGDESDALDATTSSGYLTPLHSSVHSLNAPSTTSSHSSVRTTIPFGTTHPLPSALTTISGPTGLPHSQGESLLSMAALLKLYRPKLILHPTKASGIEARYLDYIAEEMEREEGSEVREAWERCLPCFDGEHALEEIAVREGWKRKKVEGFRAIWGRKGVLGEGRHW